MSIQPSASAVSSVDSSSPKPYILIIAGGSGTRLWPLSRKMQPKQLIPVINGKSLLQHMAETAAPLTEPDHLFIVAPERLITGIKEQLPHIPTEQLVVEPAARDNGPAIMLGVHAVLQKDPDATIVVLWADHVIRTPELFLQTLQAGVDEAQKNPDTVVVFGALATEPNPGFGYIIADIPTQLNGPAVLPVKSFVEKPSVERATELIAGGAAWNLGYKAFHGQTFIDTIAKDYPAIPALLAENTPESFHQLPAESIEFLYTEKVAKRTTVVSPIGWQDMGSIRALHQHNVHESDAHSHTEGQAITLGTHNCFVRSNGKPVVVIGAEDLAVIDTDDCVFVLKYGHEKHYPDLHELLKEEYPELT